MKNILKVLHNLAYRTIIVFPLDLGNQFVEKEKKSISNLQHW